MNTDQFDCDVAIVGYGPSGVSAANFLGSYGISAIAFEREADIYSRARAVTVNDWTLRCYQSVGLADDLLAVMDPIDAIRWITYAKKEVMRVKLDPSQIGQPISSMIYQPAMEKVLRAGVERYAGCVDVRFGKDVINLTQDEAGVSVTARDLTSGQDETVRARYLLACDGGSSRIRSELGITMRGSTIDTRWVVIDTRVKRWWPERHLLTFWTDAQRPVVDIPLALGNHRWEFPLAPHESESDFETPEQLWKLLRSLGVTPDNVEIHQHAFYKHHSRYAERWRSGRVFLLGDAAHLMPPWAGSGMQSGIRDANNLCWKLREVLKGRLPDSLLDSYQAEREPNVVMYTEISESLGRVIKQQMTPTERVAMLAMGVLKAMHVPLPQPPLSGPPSYSQGWFNGSPSKRGAVGHMPPQPRVATADGRRAKLDDLLGAEFVLLADGVDPQSLLSPSQRTAWTALGARFVTLREGSQQATSESDLFDLEGTLLSWMRKRGTRCIALRPDRFVAAAQGQSLDVPSH
ncbi:bifunctional 3-(3-hydroxy-phenyl)propionate/3-hydroxycinnamic acid hydroxylase [Rhodoferax sp.]|uniref:bifunctional 3-(3-hydroxy-phenyl)propionate/3-hydroxycinnamic acid hydroxylase MhpA n=1 Tax=Rhodoferax sp. TaxID=50421 RepID=UPI002717C43C|nr:bifunctional 3-(3-hydroxy-phenyl)propionate/3-hydroxycinnamic acid hydroxylase [Rhodoferax sp.]MDO9195389.1 bifunctional 3-(3-hydroxy-phenyl)propionate/3-hydroxycinnamic acid hydroxylase [Rhodoferax sp.]